MKAHVIAVVLLPGIALASNFSERESAGKSVLATPEGGKYEESWGPILKNVMQACIPPSPTSPSNLGEFTFVADISPYGQVSNVEVKPQTKLSLCFAKKFSGQKLPPPPHEIVSSAALTVADEIKVAP